MSANTKTLRLAGSFRDIVTVNVTGDIDNGYTSDKTAAELIAAHDEGKALRCLINDVCEASLIGIDRDESLPAVWFSVHQATTVGTIVIGSTSTGGSTCSITFNALQEELPTGGTAGQVLTIGSDGSPVWADPVATSAEGVEFG